MEKNFDINEQGFSIRCKLYYNKDLHAVKNVVLSLYGFGGNKDNNPTAKFAERLTTKYKGYGVICFDWPCHGQDARNKLILSECITYLELVIKYAKEELHAEAVYNYSVSFGSYITLKYIAEKGNPFNKIALRSTAVDLYSIMYDTMTEEDKAKLAKGKEVLHGYERKIKLNKEFLDDLKSSDIRQNEYYDYADDILMIHGTKDEMAPFAEAEKFAEENVIEMIPVEKADHPFSNPKYMDFAIQKIIEFFAPEN